MKRMERAKKNRTTNLNLVALMDVFTLLVFFLMINSGASEILNPPKDVKLPDSVVQSKPRETVAIMVTAQSVLVMGYTVGTVNEIINSPDMIYQPIVDELLRQKSRVIGISTKTVSESNEVTILAHKAVPFKLLKKIMSSCTHAGYSKISLAVLEKSRQNTN